MNSVWFHMTMSNAIVASALALIAWIVGRTGKFPRATHLLWLLVLIKLVVPPFFNVPVISALHSAPPAALELRVEHAPETDASSWSLSQAARTLDHNVTSEPRDPTAQASLVWILWIWAAGSALVLLVSLMRIIRFDRSLTNHAKVAPPSVQSCAADLARRLGLATCPTVYTTDAKLTPLVWWTLGKPRIVVPSALIKHIGDDALKWVLAHELAHVRRRDHWVRLLEWFTCILWWWNPVAALARRGVRSSEEICCDAMVLSTLKPNQVTYADSLLSVVEFLDAPAFRPPSFASPFTRGGSLEWRFRMILSGNFTPWSRSLRALTTLAIIAVIPFGLAIAGEDEVGDEDHPHHDRSDHDEKSEEHAHEHHKGGDLERGARVVIAFEEVAIPKRAQKQARLYLRSEGFNSEQAEQSLKASFRLAHSMYQQGDAFKLSPQTTHHLKETIGLSEEQTKHVLVLSRKFAKMAQETQNRNASSTAMKAIRASLDAAVKKGEISEDEAKTRWIAWQDAIWAKGSLVVSTRHRKADPRKATERVIREIWADVEKGAITSEQAKLRWKLHLKHVGRDSPPLEDVKHIRQKIDDAIKSGALSKEAAEAKWSAFLQSLNGSLSQKRASLATGPKKSPPRDEMIKAMKKSLEAAEVRLRTFLDRLDAPKRGR